MVYSHVITFVVVLLSVTSVLSQLPNSCESPVYCHGPLLDTVQSAALFKDSKSFVDMSLRGTVNETLHNYEVMMDQTGNNPSKEAVQAFVDANFVKGNELEKWILPDWNPEPAFLNEISNMDIQQFAKDLVGIWPDLAKKIKPDVVANPEHYSIIPVPNGFVVPGGRFMEFFYWDSYWILQGLLISEMYETTRGMLENFISMVDRYGFVPNGGRVYFLQRSQPPFLTPMARMYIAATGNKPWLEDNIESLDNELRYWLNRLVTVEKDGKQYQMGKYNSASLGPRPESYLQDKLTAAYFSDPAKRQEVYNDLKSGAESGWDFSCRWFYDEHGSTNTNLSFIQTSRSVPVDLNSILAKAFRELADLYLYIDKTVEATFWIEEAIKMIEAIDAVHWNSEDKMWYDYDTQFKQHRKEFFISNLTPLWAQVHNPNNLDICSNVLEYLYSVNLTTSVGGDPVYLGGTPSTLDKTGEQWDSPNAWPPLQQFMVLALEHTECKEARTLAKNLATHWVEANLIGYSETGDMFEKYDAEVPGQYGGGGEYVVQSGFGWTNGVVLSFINEYYTRVKKVNLIDLGKGVFSLN